MQVPPGNYGEFGDQDAVAAQLIAVDLDASLEGRENPMQLFNDPTVRPFDLSSALGCAKNLISRAVICSAKLNFALTAGADEGFIPLADTNPYGDLLVAKYARAINHLEPAKNSIQLTDLSFAIFDELFSSEQLKATRIIGNARK